MFFRKTERKRHSVCAILTIGTLAAIGAVTVAKSGKQMLNEATKKVKSFFNKGGCTCADESEEM